MDGHTNITCFKARELWYDYNPANYLYAITNNHYKPTLWCESLWTDFFIGDLWGSCVFRSMNWGEFLVKWAEGWGLRKHATAEKNPQFGWVPWQFVSVRQQQSSNTVILDVGSMPSPSQSHHYHSWVVNIALFYSHGPVSETLGMVLLNIGLYSSARSARSYNWKRWIDWWPIILENIAFHIYIIHKRRQSWDVCFVGWWL